MPGALHTLTHLILTATRREDCYPHFTSDKVKFREVKDPIQPTAPGNGGAGIQTPSSPRRDPALQERTATTLPEPTGLRRSQAHSMCAHGLWGPRPPNSNKHLSDVSGHFPPLLWVLGKTELPLKGPPGPSASLLFHTFPSGSSDEEQLGLQIY